jgi:hypothetical protein
MFISNLKIRDTVAGGSVLAYGAQPPAMTRIFFRSECLESGTSFHSVNTWLGVVFVCLMSTCAQCRNYSMEVADMIFPNIRHSVVPNALRIMYGKVVNVSKSDSKRICSFLNMLQAEYKVALIDEESTEKMSSSEGKTRGSIKGCQTVTEPLSKNAGKGETVGEGSEDRDRRTGSKDYQSMPSIIERNMTKRIVLKTGLSQPLIGKKFMQLVTQWSGMRHRIPLTPMGVVAPGYAHARPSAQPPIDVSGTFPAHVSAESPSNMSPNPSEVIYKVSEPKDNF